MDREQLESIRRQVEEDYRLDLAAIERLQRRYLGAASTPANGSSNSAPVSAVPVGSYSSPSKWSEEAESHAEPNSESRVERRSGPRAEYRGDSRVESPIPLPPPSAPADRQRDELEGSIRNMFNGGRPVGR
jgi:hypothetical protein